MDSRIYKLNPNKTRIKIGDIISIPDERWFPSSTRNELAVVLKRYKIENYVHNHRKSYWHYGCEIMYLTGLKKGQVRKFSTKLYSNSVIGNHHLKSMIMDGKL